MGIPLSCDCLCLQGYTHPREYIVTEWPVVSTCSDLWSLVYDHDCSAVVVLCNPSPGVSNVSVSLRSSETNVTCSRILRSGQRIRSLRSTARCSRWSTSPTITTPTSGEDSVSLTVQSITVHRRQVINCLSAQVSGIPSHLFLEGTFMLCR